MNKHIVMILCATVFIMPVMGSADNPLAEDDAGKARVAVPAVAAPAVAGTEKPGLEDKAAEKEPTNKDKLLGKVVTSVGGKNTEENRNLAEGALKTTAQKAPSHFKEGVEKAKAKTASALKAREDEGLENSKKRQFFTGFKYGLWEGTKATLKTTADVIKNNPQIILAVLAAVLA